jgi:DNA-binding transcriptional LysR family regulator
MARNLAARLAASPLEGSPRTVHELAHLRTFLAVVRCGGFNAAARALKITPAAVSRSISKLEQDLGVRLLFRTTRDIRLTEAGRSYHETSRDAVERLAEATDQLISREAEISGIVRVGLPGLWARTYVLPALAAFLERHPLLQLDLYFCDQLPDLVTSGLDLGVQHSAPVGTHCVARCIQTTRAYLVASPYYLKRRGAPAEPADLLQHDCINVQMPTGPVTWQLTHAKTGARYLHAPRGKVFFSGQFESALDAATNDLGITAAEWESCYSLLEAGKLHIVLPGYRIQGIEPGALQLTLIYPDRRYVPQRVRRVMEFLTEVAQRSDKAKIDPHQFAFASSH